MVSRGTDQKFWAHQVTHTPLTEVNLFTLRYLSSLTLISRDFPVAVEQEQQVFISSIVKEMV